MARRRKHPAFRELDGILLLDKPRGLSSNQALQQVRRLYAAEKGGHTGALDPLATGLLPLCFGEATKIAGCLLAGRKGYETLARFGIETDTADADGAEIARAPVPRLDPDLIESALAPLRGRILQVPPVYSALKRDGEPLYAKARRGESVEVDARPVEVHGLAILELGPDWVRLRVDCGAGTYVRSLVRDLGAALGCGAHVVELRRISAAPFIDPPMMTLAELQSHALQGGRDALDALLLPIEAGLAGMPAYRLDAEQARRLGQGQRLAWSEAESGDGAAFDPDGQALGLVTVSAGELRPRRLFQRAGSGATASD
jgi:tRNA pseudouridine55 synthase